MFNTGSFRIQRNHGRRFIVLEHNMTIWMCDVMWQNSIGYANFYPLHLANYLVCPKDHHMNWGTHYQLRGMASTLRMRTAVSPRLWQPRSFSYIDTSSKWWQKTNKQTNKQVSSVIQRILECIVALRQTVNNLIQMILMAKNIPVVKIAFPSRKNRVCAWNKSKLIFGLHPATSKILKKQCVIAN